MNASDWKPGVEGTFYGLDAETYHRAPGFSHSMAKRMEPPARLPVYMEEKVEATVAMIMGTLVHQRTLERDKPLPKIVVKPKGMKFSETAGKEWKKQVPAGTIILTEDEYESVIGCIDSLAKDSRCVWAFAKGHSEVSLFKTHPCGVLCKGRLDFVPFGNRLVDIKKCLEGHGNPMEFSKLMYDKRYYSQAAWYLALWNALNPEDQKDEFVFYAVEGTKPYLVNEIVVSPKAIEFGMERNFKNLIDYDLCTKTKEWPGYTGSHVVDVPGWARHRNNDEAHAAWLSQVRRAE